MMKGKTTFKSVSVDEKLNSTADIENPNIIWQHIAEITTQKFNEAITCTYCKNGTSNIIFVCDKDNINQILNPDYCASVNITVPPRDVLSFIVSSNLDSKSDSFVIGTMGVILSLISRSMIR